MKRSGEKVEYSLDKIENAIYKGMLAIEHDNKEDAKKVAKKVDKRITKFKKHHKDFVPNVEDIQDMVELELMRE